MSLARYNYISQDGKTLHVLNLTVFTETSNSKIAHIGELVLQTYHFSMQQVKNNDLTLDKNNCLDCKFSYNQNSGKSGGCYTHKGTQKLGIGSMLRALSKRVDSIKKFSEEDFKTFLDKMDKFKVDLVRFGAYGEPVLLSLDIIESLTKRAKRYTGYTHQWVNPKNKLKAKFFMASVHNVFEQSLAQSLDFRTFRTNKLKDINTKEIMCPANKTVSCTDCGACNGFNNKAKQKSIYINQH